LAQAQDLLMKGTADRVDLRELALSQLGHFQDAVGKRIDLSGPDVNLAPSAAQAIGMALHELSTNAGKYGALSDEDGAVDIVWQVRADATESPMFSIGWSERDGPPVVPPQNRGFGSSVIHDMIQVTLNAEVALDFAADGVKWTLTCKLADLTAS
jgi:two-component sensor histidine kinase